MTSISGKWTALAAALAVSGMLAVPAGAADLPKATQEVLQKLKLTPDVLSGLDKELAVPQAWVDAAKKEGTLLVRLNLSEQNYDKLRKPFEERYPYIKNEYTRGVGADRSAKPLLAFKTGRYIADIVMGFSDHFDDYMAAHALAKIDDLPTWDNVAPELRHPGGLFSAYNVINWCMSYNLDKVKKSELPKTWDELITNPRWRNGRVGVANRPQLFLLHLWGSRGETYARNYMHEFFHTLKPQLRKEAINGMMKLASIGEFDLAMPSAGYRVKIQVNRGAKIGFHCPEPAPANPSDVGIFSGSPRINSAKIFLNWLLSKEGQVALHYADGSRPSHKELGQLSAVLPYPDAVKGKKIAARQLDWVKSYMSPMFAAWNKEWLAAGGPSRKKR